MSLPKVEVVDNVIKLRTRTKKLVLLADHGYLEAEIEPRLNTLHIKDIYVEPDHRRKGIGTSLIEHCIREMHQRNLLTAMGCFTTRESVELCKTLFNERELWVIREGTFASPGEESPENSQALLTYRTDGEGFGYDMTLTDQTAH